MIKPAARTAFLALAAVLTVSAAPKTVGWTSTVALTPGGGYLLGNPAAKVKLVEYVSYTCGYCARYNIQSEGVLQLAYIPSGKVSIEVRHVVRSPVDLAVTMLAACGDKRKFFLNHNALLRSQPRWMSPMTHASSSQRFRWQNPDLGTRNRAIAADLKLYDVMATRGYDRQSLERCLTDKALAQRITAQSDAALADGVEGTPSFSINGKLLKDTHDWAALRPQLDESLR